MKNFEILNKYNSALHQKSKTGKELNYLNRQDYISNVENLPKTIQAYYYAVEYENMSKNTNSSNTSTQSITSNKSNFDNIDEFSFSEKNKTKQKGLPKNKTKKRN